MSSYTLSTRPPAPSNSSTSNSSLPRPRPSSSVDVFSAAPNTGSTTLFTPFDPSPASPDALQHDPLDSLARSKTPFFLAIQEEPRTPSRFSLTLGDLSHGRGSPESPLQALNEGISGSTAWSGGAVGGAVWTSPGGVQGSMAPASKMDFGTAAEVSSSCVAKGRGKLTARLGANSGRRHLSTSRTRRSISRVASYSSLACSRASTYA